MATQGKNLSELNKDIQGKGKGKKIGVVTSMWNEEITEKMREGAIKTLIQCGVKEKNITQMSVPGSLELVNGARKMIKKNQPDAVIVIGCVIQGETKHFDYVCQGVTQGVSYLNATQDVPVIFCVLTDNNIEQSRQRSGGIHGNKGVEAAVTAIEMSCI